MRTFLLFLLCSLPAVGKAHPVSLSWAKARISDEKITVNFRILAEDLILFHHYQPNEFYDYDGHKLKELAAYHAKIIQQYFYIVNENKVLSSKIISINTGALDKEKINAMDLMKIEIFYQLVFEVAAWDELVFHQEFSSIRGGIPAITFLSVSRDGKQLVDKVEVIPGRPFTLKPEGNKPEVNPSELTSSHYTITQNGVRHEMTIPAAVLKDLVYQPLLEKSFYEKSACYFRNSNPVIINGSRSSPELQYFQALDASDDSNALPEEGYVYFDLFYPAGTGVDSARILWTDYNWKFRWFKSEIQSIDSTYQHIFSRFQQEYLWKPRQNLVKED